ncbi:hypothetical protein PAPYR_6395 [Paratrimastix pyriformis]|uniref:PB1 domain-containing protein n=1 Tax=Paratrimastix pyriformis TaxID=342808 RepID=A0ABQ8UJW7_9EUKA|nr:hypothetical protein PAPYR_6395 [Paratrimastix pyriformis]
MLATGHGCGQDTGEGWELRTTCLTFSLFFSHGQPRAVAEAATHPAFSATVAHLTAHPDIVTANPTEAVRLFDSIVSNVRTLGHAAMVAVAPLVAILAAIPNLATAHVGATTSLLQAIDRLAQDAPNTVAFDRAGVVQPLVAHIKACPHLVDNQPGVAQSLLAAIGFLARNRAITKAFGRAGVAGPMVALFPHPLNLAATVATGALLFAIRNLTQDPELAASFGRAGVAGPLAAVMDNLVVCLSEEITQLILGVVTNLSSNPDNLTGCLQVLDRLFDTCAAKTVLQTIVEMTPKAAAVTLVTAFRPRLEQLREEYPRLCFFPCAKKKSVLATRCSRKICSIGVVCHGFNCGIYNALCLDRKCLNFFLRSACRRGGTRYLSMATQKVVLILTCEGKTKRKVLFPKDAGFEAFKTLIARQFAPESVDEISYVYEGETFVIGTDDTLEGFLLEDRPPPLKITLSGSHGEQPTATGTTALAGTNAPKAVSNDDHSVSVAPDSIITAPPPQPASPPEVRMAAASDPNPPVTTEPGNGKNEPIADQKQEQKEQKGAAASVPPAPPGADAPAGAPAEAPVAFAKVWKPIAIYLVS